MSGAIRGLAAAFLVVASLAGCSSSSSSGKAEMATSDRGTTTLTADLVSPVDVTLRWKGNERGAAGRIVEFATERKGPWTVLKYVPMDRTSYRHPDLMPRTSFFYRLRPYYGPASKSVEVDLPEGGFSEKDQRNDHEWAPPRTIPPKSGKPPATASVRTSSTADAAAPTGLRATVMHANGIGFTWTDHAGDEAGYLLEHRTKGSREFSPVAVLDKNINAVGLITLPDEKHAAYRVRAYYYGERSNVVTRRTGEAP